MGWTLSCYLLKWEGLIKGLGARLGYIRSKGSSISLNSELSPPNGRNIGLETLHRAFSSVLTTHTQTHSLTPHSDYQSLFLTLGGKKVACMVQTTVIHTKFLRCIIFTVWSYRTFRGNKFRGPRMLRKQAYTTKHFTSLIFAV